MIQIKFFYGQSSSSYEHFAPFYFSFHEKYSKTECGDRKLLCITSIFSLLSPERSTEFKIKLTNNISVTGIIPSNDKFEKYLST